MPNFRFKARTWDGLLEEGTVEAASLYDFYAEMNERQLRVEKVVDVSSLQPAPPRPAPQVRRWPLPVFALLQLLLAGLIVQAWLHFRLLLLPALAAQTLMALLAWQRARPGPLLGPHLVEELADSPTWLRLALALLLALALGQLAAEVGQHGLALPPRSIFLRGVLGAGAAVALAITGSGLTAALKGRLR